jgi:phage tail P2-like protein
MSKSIYDITLLELLPENLRNDPDIIAASAAVDQEFQLMVQAISNCLIFVDIDNVSEEVVDLLAAEMGADFYEQDLPLANKRQIVKNAYLYKYTKGTPFAVRQLLNDAFETGQLQEWFVYGGQPYNFRLIATAEELADSNKLQKLIDAINSVKNERSNLEGYYAFGTHESLRSFTHDKLSAYTHQKIASGEPLI